MPCSARVVFAALALAAGVAVGAGANAAEREKERSDVPEEISVTAGGVRYEAVHWGKSRGLGQNGGYIQAVKADDGAVLWLHRIYRIEYDPGKEQDKQDRFIAALTISARGDVLQIRDERGHDYSLDLNTHRVKQRAAKTGAR